MSDNRQLARDVLLSMCNMIVLLPDSKLIALRDELQTVTASDCEWWEWKLAAPALDIANQTIWDRDTAAPGGEPE